jgi:hypothetical protein
MSLKRFEEDRRSGAERRSSTDRRSGTERRGGLGGVIDFVVEAERRRTERRAKADRRTRVDRRKPPAAQYSWTDTLKIQKMVDDPSREVVCPRCGGTLLLGPLEFAEGVTTCEVHCTACRYSVAILQDG